MPTCSIGKLASDTVLVVDLLECLAAIRIARTLAARLVAAATVAVTTAEGETARLLMRKLDSINPVDDTGDSFPLSAPTKDACAELGSLPMKEP